MRETYNSTADEPGSSDSDSQSELSLKPGETITLKLAKVHPSSSLAGVAVLPCYGQTKSGMVQHVSHMVELAILGSYLLVH